MSNPRHRTAAEAVKKIRLQVKCRAIDESDLNFQSNDLFLETGAYGKVKRAQFEGVQVAVKYFRSAEEKRGYNQELVFLSCLQKHDNIVTLFGTGLSKNSKEPYIVMEFAPYSLERVLHGPVPRYWYGPDHVMHWSRQVAVGLQYIHEKRILHRDIKASNLLLFGNGSHLKLCDFGTCRNLETNLLYTANIGTVRYMAPEVIKGEPYTTKCDIFSFAITLWEMIARKVPTVDASAQLNTYAILFQMAEGKRPPLFTNVPVIITELLVTCWHQEPQKRLPSAEVAKKLINICKYFEFGQPLGYETTGSDETGFESMSSTCTDEKILSEQNEEEEEPSSPLITDEYHMSRTQSDLTQVKAVIEDLNNKEKRSIPPGYYPQMSIPVVQQHQKYLPTSQNFSHGYPPHDSYPSPKGIKNKDDMSMVMRKNPDGGPEIMVDHEVHEVLDPNSEDKRYVSLDENRLRFDVQCQYLQIEQAYQSQHTSLPSRVSSILKSKSSRNLEETSKACGNSPYVIPGLPPDLQPVVPNESDPESIRIWENYKKLTQHLKPS